MKNIASFSGRNTDFKEYLDEAIEKVNDSKALVFPYYVCGNCGFSAWTVKNESDNHRCSECGFPVELITEIENTFELDKHIYSKRQNASMEEDNETSKPKLVASRYGFKRA